MLLSVSRLFFSFFKLSPCSIQLQGKKKKRGVGFFFCSNHKLTLPKPLISSLFTAIIFFFHLFFSSKIMTCWFCFLASFLQKRFSLSVALLGFQLPSSIVLFNSSHHVDGREMH